MLKTLFISLILVSTLAGCASFTSLKDKTDDSYTRQSQNWYPLPSVGAKITVHNNYTNDEITVTVIDSYHAASGHSCSLYSTNESMDTSTPSGLACRIDNRWIEVPFIVNPDAHPADS